MEMTERKKKILRVIVEEYIRTAEPVSSKSIASLPEIDASSATVRNEMSDLTAMGYLEQPHTSAGRIPSPSGYRLYIDELMQDYRLSADETRTLNQAMESRIQQFDDVLSQASRLLSRMTNLPAYSVASRKSLPTVKKFELIAAETGSVILVVMTSHDVVKNRLVRLPLNCTEQDLRMLSAILNAAMTGLTAGEFTPELMERVTRSAGAAEPLVPIIFDYTTHLLQAEAQNEVFLSGQMKLLGQPEYRDPEKAQELLSHLDEDVISSLPAAIRPDSKMQILVGPENVARELKDTSVVMTRFDIGDGMQGMIGVVGPTRMDYAQVTARLSYFTESLSRMFGKTEPPVLPESAESKPQK